LVLVRKQIDYVGYLLGPVAVPSLRRAEVAVALFDKPSDQTRIAEQILGPVRGLETCAEEGMKRSGVVDAVPGDVEQARGQRLDIEITLLKAKWPIKPHLHPGEKPALKPELGDNDLRKLLKERYSTALEECRIRNARFDVDRINITIDRMSIALLRGADVTRDLFAKPEERLRYLERLLGLGVHLEKTIIAGSGPGTGVHSKLPDVEKTDGLRLDLEIMLLREKQRAKAGK
jgi:hypothetical protein